MATYNVGNVEVGVQADTTTAESNIDKLISKFNKLQSTTSKELNVSLEKTIKDVKEVGKASKNINKSFSFGRMYTAFNYLRGALGYVVKMISMASDYVETLNKFQVSFASLYKENLDYVNKISKAYGFSRVTLMEYTSTFNNMLKSLDGLTDEMSAKLSRTLTQMAIDYSSLFNTSIETTMTAFQAMLSGSIRPIRSTSGFDVSDTTIMALYQSLGGTKSSRELTQLEKRLLRILAVQKQLVETGATGDFYKTIETFSNQVKILTEQVKEFATIWGRIFLVQLKPVIQWVNGLLMALNEIGEALTKDIEIANDMNIDDEFAGFSKIENSATDAANAVDKLNNKLLGLDQINVLSSSGSVSSIGGIDQAILDNLNEYTSKLDSMQMKAHEIAEDILNWLGYTRDINGELQYTGGNLEVIKFTLGVIIGYKLSTLLISLYTTLSSINIATLGSKLAVVALAYSIVSLIANWDRLDTKTKILLILVAAVTSAFLAMKAATLVNINVLTTFAKVVITKVIASIKSLNIVMAVHNITMTQCAIAVAAWVATIAYIANIDKIPPKIRTVIGVIAALTSALFLGAAAWMAFHGAMTLGAAVITIGVGLAAGAAAIASFIANAKQASSNIPQLAKGGVLDKPTTVQVAEYAGAKNNPEIVTPENKMREVFNESQIPMINAIYSIGDNIVNAIENSEDKPIYINGKKVSESIYNDLNAVAIRKGKRSY